MHTGALYERARKVFALRPALLTSTTSAECSAQPEDGDTSATTQEASAQPTQTLIFYIFANLPLRHKSHRWGNENSGNEEGYQPAQNNSPLGSLLARTQCSPRTARPTSPKLNT